MDREFCIAYITDDCAICPELSENESCSTDSHCFDVKQKIITDLRKLDKIEQIVADYGGSTPSKIKQFIEIQKVLEQENVDKTCDNCKYHTDAEEIHGKTPCGTCGREHINFCKKE